MGVFQFEPIFETDLRSARGGELKLLRCVSITGNYTSGGVVIEPEDLGLNTIYMVELQGSYCVPSDIEDLENSTWGNIILSTMRFNFNNTVEWKMLAFLQAGDTHIEVPDGTPMSFDERLAPVALAFGS